MRTYVGHHTAGDTRSTHGTLLRLVRRVEDASNKLYMDNCFTPPEFLQTYTTEKLFAVALFGIT